MFTTTETKRMTISEILKDSEYALTIFTEKEVKAVEIRAAKMANPTSLVVQEWLP